MKKVILTTVLLLVILLCVICSAEEYGLTADGYALVTTSSEAKWFPLADDTIKEYDFTVKQVAPDGTESYNIIVVDTEGVVILESDCDNQDCVDEGKVTLENKDKRVLGNMIVCLPHQLTVELYSRDELTELLESYAAASDTEAAQ